MSQGFPPGQLPPDGPGLVMASYDDLGAVSFWKSLECTPEQEKQSDKLMSTALQEHKAAASGDGRLQQYELETQQALIDDRGLYYAPPEMRSPSRPSVPVSGKSCIDSVVSCTP